MLPQFVHTAQSLDDFPFLLEVERNRHHTNRQQPFVLRHFRHDRSRASSRATAHSGSDEHHFCSVVEQPFDVLDVALRLFLAHFGVCAGTQTHRAQLQFHGHGRLRERCAIGVAHGESHALDALVIHVSHGILSAATYADDLDDVLRLVFDDAEVNRLFFLFVHICFSVFFALFQKISCKDTTFFRHFQPVTRLARKNQYHLS